MQAANLLLSFSSAQPGSSLPVLSVVANDRPKILVAFFDKGKF